MRQPVIPGLRLTDPKSPFFDHLQRRTAVLDPATIIYGQDSGDTEVEVKSIDDIMAIWPKLVNLDECRRLGLRKWYIIPTNHRFEDLVALLNSRALRMEDMASFLPKITDSYIRFDASEDGYNFHIAIGPVQRKEIFSRLEFSHDHLNPGEKRKDAQKVVESYPETGILIDIDFFQNGSNLKKEEMIKFLIHGRERIKKIAEDCSKFIFADTQL